MRKIDFEKTKEGRLMRYDSDHKVYCKNLKCSGHGVVFRAKDQDKKLCPNGNEWIFRNEKARLKYEIKKRGVKIEN